MTENDQRVQASSDSFVGIVVAGTRNMLNTQVFFVCVCACVCACMRTCMRACVGGGPDCGAAIGTAARI